MPRTIKYGPNSIEYDVFTRQELVDMGFSPNPHLYIGNGMFFCIPCTKYHRHYGMTSHSGKHAEVCSVCEQYTRGTKPGLKKTTRRFTV